MYLREEEVTEALDEWLLRHFDPENLDTALEAMAAAQGPDDAGAARAEAARQKIEDCDDRLRKYRSALEAGADPAIVVGWMKECEADRLLAESDLRETVYRVPLGVDELRALVAAVRPTLANLSGADPEARKAIYQAMGLRLTYHPERNAIAIDACTQVRVGGGT